MTKTLRRPNVMGRSVTALVAAAGVFLGGAVIGAGAAHANAGPSVVATSVIDPADPDAVTSALEQARAEFWTDPEVQAAAEQMSQLGAAPALLDWETAKKFGKFAFEKGGPIVGPMIWKEAMSRLGFDVDHQAGIVAALSDIQGSIEALTAQNQQIIQALDGIHKELQWQNFLNADAGVSSTSTRIKTELDVVAFWIGNDITPSAATVERTMNLLSHEVAQLQVQATNDRTGAIPLLMKAYERNVSNTDQFWQTVEDYRDQVRALSAQAIMGMNLVAENWDNGTGEFEGRIHVANESGIQTVADMYAVGVAPTGPADQPLVQVRDGMAISAGLFRNEIPADQKWLWESTASTVGREVMTREILEPYLQDMVDQYRPENHDGQTLEQFLEANEMATSFGYADTWRVRKTTGSGTLERDVRYQMQVTIGVIDGNAYRTENLRVGETRYAYTERWGVVNGWTVKNTDANKADKAEADKWVTNQATTWTTRMSEESFHWRNHTDAAGKLVYSKTGTGDGISGFLTDTRPDSIDQAAFGN